jgi:hypothetical protein
MRSGTFFLVLVAGMGMLVQVASSPIEAQQSASIEAPHWDVGDHWTWHRSTGADISYTVLSVTSDGYSVHVRNPSAVSVNTFPPTISPENTDFLYYQWPLELGKRWANKVSGQFQGRATTWTVTRTVVGQESVTVPAGTFDALRISGRHCNDLDHYCGDFVVWYASKAKNAVMLTWSGPQYWPPFLAGATQLLTAYEVHSP